MKVRMTEKWHWTSARKAGKYRQQMHEAVNGWLPKEAGLLGYSAKPPQPNNEWHKSHERIQ